eukprot:980888_1
MNKDSSIALTDSTSSPIGTSPANEPSNESNILDGLRSPFSVVYDEKEEDLEVMNIQSECRYMLDDGRTGVCAFIGDTFFGRGEWIGLILDHISGNTNGSINNKQYFDCDPQKGLFVRRPKIVQYLPTQSISQANEDNTVSFDTKIAVSFFDHERGESNIPHEVENEFKMHDDEDTDNDELSLEFDLNSPYTDPTPSHDDDEDDTPDTFRKLNELFSYSSEPTMDGDLRRVSMMETLNHDTQIISALRPVRRRMKMYTRSDSWTPINFKKKEEQNNSFLRPKLYTSSSSEEKKKLKKANTSRKMGPIDIGRLDYPTNPYHNIEKSPFDMEKYKNWYPKRYKGDTDHNNKPKRHKLKRSTSTIDPHWTRSRHKTKKSNKDMTHLAWIEHNYVLIKNPSFQASVSPTKRVRIKQQTKEKKKKKRKKKGKAKSTRVNTKHRKKKKKKKTHPSSPTKSGQLIRLNGSERMKGNDRIMDDEEEDHEEKQALMHNKMNSKYRYRKNTRLNSRHTDIYL